MERKEKNAQQTLQSVEHALDILEAFSCGSASLTMSEIMESTRLHKSTAYRLVKVLMKRGYLERDAVNATYSLGYCIIGLASSRINDLELVAEAHPLIMRLNAETSLTAQLCVLDGTDVIYMDEVSGTSARRFNSMGGRGPAYCSSLGKCLLAALSGDALEALFVDYHFIKFTENTITSFPQLKKELKKVRSDGYALNDRESSPILSSIACPIYDYKGNTIAALSLGAASYLFIPETLKNLLPHLQHYAMAISQRMGYEIDQTP